jgi:hypothetical protein
MKVEFGFQANCSEITLSLEIATKANVMEAMRKIEEITGWSWWVWAWYQKEKGVGGPRSTVYLRIPMERLDEFYLWIDDGEGKVSEGIDLGRLIEFHQESIPAEMVGKLWDDSEPPDDYSAPALVDLSADDHVVVSGSSQIGIKITMMMVGHTVKDEARRDRMEFSIDGYDFNLLPALHLIREHYDGTVGGQDSRHYYEWWDFHSQFVGKPYDYATIDNPNLYDSQFHVDVGTLNSNPPLKPLKETHDQYLDRKRKEEKAREQLEKQTQKTEAKLQRKMEKGKRGFLDIFYFRKRGNEP